MEWCKDCEKLRCTVSFDDIWTWRRQPNWEADASKDVAHIVYKNDAEKTPQCRAQWFNLEQVP